MRAKCDDETVENFNGSKFSLMVQRFKVLRERANV